jgi:hypothetical protein
MERCALKKRALTFFQKLALLSAVLLSSIFHLRSSAPTLRFTPFFRPLGDRVPSRRADFRFPDFRVWSLSGYIRLYPAIETQNHPPWKNHSPFPAVVVQ